MIKVTVEGEYYCLTEGHKDTQPYKEDFIVPREEGALSLIVNKLLKARLQKKYPGAKTYRTHEITQTKPAGKVSTKKEIKDMNREELSNYIIANDLPLEAKDFWMVKDLRREVQDALDEEGTPPPKADEIDDAERKAGSIAELARQLEVHLRTVNRWVRDDTPPSSLAQNRLWDYLK